MRFSRSAAPGFALGDFAKECEVLLVEGQVVFSWAPDAPGSRWQRICTLSAIENCDAAPLVRQAPGYAGRADAPQTSQTSWNLRRILPGRFRVEADAALEFVVQAERLRRGESNLRQDVVNRSRLQGECLRSALGPTTSLIFDNSAHTSQIPNLSRVSTNGLNAGTIKSVAGQRRPLAEIREDYWRRLQLRFAAPSEEKEDLESAARILVETARSESSFLGMTVLYECAETGFRVLARSSGAVVLALSSDAFVVEDADGRLYRFGPFVVTLDAEWEDRSCTPPVLDYPADYVHWLPEFRQGRPLHLCDMINDHPYDAHHISNAVNLLLGTRKIVRSSLYGGTVYGDSPQLSGRRFASLRITRQQVDELGLPVYPYNRGNRTSGDFLLEEDPVFGRDTQRLPDHWTQRRRRG